MISRGCSTVGQWLIVHVFWIVRPTRIVSAENQNFWICQLKCLVAGSLDTCLVPWWKMVGWFVNHHQRRTAWMFSWLGTNHQFGCPKLSQVGPEPVGLICQHYLNTYCVCTERQFVAICAIKSMGHFPMFFWIYELRNLSWEFSFSPCRWHVRISSWFFGQHQDRLAALLPTWTNGRSQFQPFICSWLCRHIQIVAIIGNQLNNLVTVAMSHGHGVNSLTCRLMVVYATIEQRSTLNINHL